MDRTSIECPSCNRKIFIALIPPLVSELLPLDLTYSHLPNKEYDLRDLLYVHEELIRENSYLRKVISKLQNNFK
jgi:hypothetical protein